MEKHTNKMHKKNFFKLLSVKQFMKFFVLHSLSVFLLMLCPWVVAGQEIVCYDVYCAHTRAYIGQPSRTDALSTSLSVLLWVASLLSTATWSLPPVCTPLGLPQQRLL